jgi:hypothetical protein
MKGWYLSGSEQIQYAEGAGFSYIAANLEHPFKRDCAVTFEIHEGRAVNIRKA